MTVNQSETRKQTGVISPSRIIKKIWIKASTAIVYGALTDSKELSHWFCDRASCEPKEGGELAAWWKSGKSSQTGRAVITRIVPESFIEFLWIDDGHEKRENSQPHTLVYELCSKSGLTALVMTDNDEAASDEEENALLAQGWNSVLLELKDYCERKERSTISNPRKKQQRNSSV